MFLLNNFPTLVFIPLNVFKTSQLLFALLDTITHSGLLLLQCFNLLLPPLCWGKRWSFRKSISLESS